MIGKNLVAGSLLLLPVVAFAQDSKPFSVGLASFATSVDYTVEYEYGLDDDEEQTFSGPAIFGTAAVNDNLAFRVLYGWQDHTDESDIELETIEGTVLGGIGLASEGFKAYGSLGFFRDDLDWNDKPARVNTDTFKGLALGAGAGYSWPWVSVELWISVRDNSDYEDALDDYYAGQAQGIFDYDEIEYLSVVTAGIGASVRF